MRCYVCGNRKAYCSCNGGPVKAPTPTKRDDRTDYEKQRDAAKANAPYDCEPTPLDMLITAMRGDWTQDVLCFCPMCGITLDPECAYGGWHDESHWVRVSVGWADLPAHDEAEHGRGEGEDGPDLLLGEVHPEGEQ